MRSYLVLFLALITQLSSSQTPSFNFQKLGSEEGLNNANIFSIDQHQNGLMYFTTQNGIYYYDGYNFNKLEIDSLKSNALINASFKSRNELYLSLRDDGIATFNLDTKKFTRDPRLNLADNNADNIIITKRFAFLLISSIKIVIVDLKTGRVMQDELKKRENLAYCLFQTSDGKVLLGRGDGLYDLTNGKQTRLEILKNTSVYSIAQDLQGRLLVGTSGKIVIVNKGKIEQEITPVYKRKSSTFMPDGGLSINKLIADNYGRIWFSSFPEENLFLYENNMVYDIFEVLDIPPSLIKCIFKDNQENIWIGTNNDGVYLIQNPFFTSLNFSFNNKVLNINQVFLKKDLLVAATSNGLYGLSLTNFKTKTLSQPDETFIEPIYNISELNDVVYYTKINEINVFPSLFVVSGGTYKFRPVIARLFYPIDKQHSVIADWNLNILLCNADGSVTIDTLISFTDYRISVNSLLKKEELLYIGTSNGLFTYNFNTKKNQNIVRTELNYNINDMAMIGDKLYAAHEGGITEVDGGKLIQQIGNFRLNTVKKIKQFEDQVWLATLDGVFICDRNLQPLKTLNKSNGLLSNSVNDITFNGQTIGIATARGVSITDFKNILRYNSKLRPVTIDRITSNGDRVADQNGEYVFSPNQENISVYFYSPVFNKPNKQYFKWKMDEGDWNFFSNLSFEASLIGGPHVIAISASPDNITWSNITELKIKKEEKMTERQSMYWLFTLASLFVIASISFVWIRRVNLKGKKRLREEQQVNLLKHRAMNSLLSPHFIFNSLTSIQNYINTNNGLRASEYLAKFSRLIRMIIEKASQSHISLFDELTRLTYYLELEKERFKNKFDYSIHISDDINTNLIEIPNMIIQPHVENCIIHGILPKQEPGELSLDFKKLPNGNLLITIEDNGIGLIKAQEHAKTGHKSLGTATIRDILEINAKLTGKKQVVSMTDKSTLDPEKSGTIIQIELEL
ncbi:MAG: histidine kinase [bacterium]|nr:histidine kinase [bacterium]